MSARKARREKQMESDEAPRFTPDDIVRAIEAIQQTGLTVYAVEITLNGSINISTSSPFKRRAASRGETIADTQAEVQPSEKLA